MRRRGIGVMILVFLLLLWPTQAAQPPGNGQYTIEVSLSGGTGRAGITSPATLTVSGGAITATIVWSSPYYEFMRVNGVEYPPVQAEGNATFEIPVVLDEEMAVSAQTIAMSQPHEIDYRLYFDSSTLKPLKAGGSGRQVLIIVVAGAACALAVGAIVVAARRKRRATTGEAADE